MSYYFVKQHDQNDCGPACLSMILGRYGCKLLLGKLREEIKTDVNGSTMYGIVKTAEKYGLNAEPLHGEFQEFCNGIQDKSILFPMIINIISAEGNSHFVVAHKIKKSKLYIADPASKIYKMSLEELEKIWIGNIICFKGFENIVKVNEFRLSMDKYFSVCKKQNKLIALIVLISFGIATIGMLGALIFEYVIDGIYSENFNLENMRTALENKDSVDMMIIGLINRFFPSLTKLCIAIIVLYFFRAVISWMRTYILSTMSKRINIPVMMTYFEHVLKVPINFFSGRKTGDIMSRFGDASSVCEDISNVILTILIDGTLMICYGIFLFVLSPILFLVIFISSLLYIITTICFKNRIKSNQLDIMEKNAEINSLLKENIDGVKTIKQFNIEENIISRFYKKFTKFINISISGSLLIELQSNIISFLSSTSVIIMLLFGVQLCVSGNLYVGSLITFYAMMDSFIEPVKSLVGMQANIQSIIVSAERLDDVFMIDKDSKYLSKFLLNTKEKIESVCIDNLTFSYGYSKPVLDNVSFKINKGEKVAIVGKNGCGKTTLANILMGLLNVETCDISLNGTDISYDEYKKYAFKIAYIPQESFFFSDTIYENIICGVNDITDKELDSYISKCCLKEYLSSINSGIFAKLDENGNNLSAGNKQKLAILRALVRKPEIIILDEATSNVDIQSEDEIHKMLMEIKDDITIVDISHKIRDFDSYDRVYSINNGKSSCVVNKE